MICKQFRQMIDELYRKMITLVKARLALGRERYGHGVIVDEDPTKYGVKTNDWMEMALEELLDGLVYYAAAIIRRRRELGILVADDQPDDNEKIINLIETCGTPSDDPKEKRLFMLLGGLKALVVCHQCSI